VITLRHSTVGDADETIVLSDRRIVESVNHLQLLRNPGHYEQMWVCQSSGFSGDLDNDNVISNRVERAH
jgi:ABC-type multidrug transport system fused ATPase/permease subunit